MEVRLNIRTALLTSPPTLGLRSKNPDIFDCSFKPGGSREVLVSLFESGFLFYPKNLKKNHDTLFKILRENTIFW